MKLKLGKAVAKAKKERSMSGAKPRSHIKKVYPRAKKAEPMEAPTTEKKWVAPTYSQIRHVTLDADKLMENRCVSLLNDAVENSYYEVLRAQIQIEAKKKGLRTIMVTSAEPGDGKTVTCINLAASFAKAHHQTVMLVDADLKKQQVHKYLDIESPYGLADVLINEKPVTDCLIWPGVDKLVLMSGGKTLRESSEILGSPMMNEFVQDVRNRYEDRYVFFDVPPVLIGADTLAFAQMVDGIVFVAETGKTSKDHFQKAMELLPDEKILGVVLNQHEATMNNYYYEYYKS